MYKIRRFSLLYERLFSGLNDAKRHLETEAQDKMIVHLILFMKNENKQLDNHWGYVELTEFIVDLPSRFIGTWENKFSYDMMFSKLSSTGIKNDSFRKSVEKKINEEVKSKNSSIPRDSVMELMNDEYTLSLIVKLLSSKLEEERKRLGRILGKSDKKLIYEILLDVRGVYTSGEIYSLYL